MVELAAEKINNYNFETGQEAFLAESKINDHIEFNNQFRSFIGQVALRRVIEDEFLELKEENLSPFRSLYQAIESVKIGVDDAIKQPASQMIKQNIRSNLGEITRMSGYVGSPVKSKIFNNKILQHDHDYDDIYANTLIYTDQNSFLYPISQIETKNYLMMKELVFSAQLNDNYFVIISGTPDDEPETTLADNGYCVDKMPVSIQVMTVQDDQLLTQTAFVAGRVTSNDKRHDRQAIIGMAKSFGIDYDSLPLKEILAKPILIPKSALPEGILGLVKKYDQVLGDTFFGDNKPAQDYNLFQEQCHLFETNLEPLVDSIYTDLITDKLVQDDVGATEALKKYSKEGLVKIAVTDRTIDPIVFGNIAAGHLETARIAFDNNDQIGLRRSLNFARKTARSFSCPTALINNNSSGDSLSEDIESSDQMPNIIRCPECGNFVPKKIAFHKGNLRCGSCRYEVELCSGRIVHASTAGKVA